MKNLLKKTPLFLTLASFAIFTAACDNKPDDAKEVAEEVNEEKIDTRKGEKDAEFLVAAADINLMEVEMGKMASRATMPEVKAFGSKMVTEHQNSYNELVTLAASKNITIPSTVSDEGMKNHENLNDKAGYDFDRDFMDKMVDGHEKAVNKFEEAADDCEDADIKAWASKSLPSLKAHLEEAKALKERVKDMK